MAGDDFVLDVVEREDGEAVAAVEGALIAFNKGRAPADGYLPLNIFVKDSKTGAVLGGLVGKSFFGWLYVNYLVVPERCRGAGLGRRLMGQAEEIARARGCVGIWLDTFEFQARGFYETLGFSVFGTVEDHPVGQSRYFMRKRFDRPVKKVDGP